jgi:hypothetical protein
MPDAAQLNKFYKIFSWASLAGLVLMLGLLLRKSPPPNIPYDPNAADRVQKKFAAAEQAKSEGQPAQVQMDRTELNSYLEKNLQFEGSDHPAAPSSAVPVPDGGATGAILGANGSAANGSVPAEDQATLEQVQSSVKDVKVDMDGDLVKAYVTFDFHGKDMSLELDGHLGAQDGYIKFDPVAGKLGELPLPQSTLESAVEKMMASPENRDKLKLPSDISDIQIVNGQAVVSYK